jgi:hypothetical protein
MNKTLQVQDEYTLIKYRYKTHINEGGNCVYLKYLSHTRGDHAWEE